MKKYIVLILVISAFTSACNSLSQNNKTEKYEINGFTQGTYYSIKYFSEDTLDLKPIIDSLLLEFSNSASVYDTNSIISKWNNNKDVVLDSIVYNLINLSVQISEETNGAFDVAISPIINAWGFGFAEQENISQELIDEMLEYCSYKNIVINENSVSKTDSRLSLNFNAIAQGYSVSYIANYFYSIGITDFLIDIGGEIYASGTKNDDSLWKVGIETPQDSAEYGNPIADIAITNQAIATSGNYRKFYIKDNVRYSHTINPKTGYPVSHSLLSASVVCNSCALADAYATSFMVMGLEKAKEFVINRSDIEAYFIYSDENGEMQTWMSDGLVNILNETK